MSCICVDKVILFLSDGRPTDVEAEILQTISEQNAKLGNQVVINTFGIGQYASEYGQISPTKQTFLVSLPSYLKGLQA